jgi:Fe2+ or Zn2+ uptake regulation protein
VIRELKLTTGSEAKAASAPARRRRSAPRSTGRRPGRARGAVREGLIAAFAASDREMSADDVREALAPRGVKTSTDNLYQQLRRLVQAGELTRVGRGRYVRAPTAAAA